MLSAVDGIDEEIEVFLLIDQQGLFGIAEGLRVGDIGVLYVIVDVDLADGCDLDGIWNLD